MLKTINESYKVKKFLESELLTYPSYEGKGKGKDGNHLYFNGFRMSSPLDPIDKDNEPIYVFYEAWTVRIYKERVEGCKSVDIVSEELYEAYRAIFEKTFNA